MTTTVIVLLEGTLATTAGVGKVASEGVTAIDKITATNEAAAAAVATVQLISPDGTLTQAFSKTIQPGAAWPFPEVAGHVLAIGGKINVLSPAANAIRVRISGRQFT